MWIAIVFVADCFCLCRCVCVCVHACACVRVCLTTYYSVLERKKNSRKKEWLLTPNSSS